jgi:hypothetical protein
MPLIAGTVALLLLAAGCSSDEATTAEAASSPLAEFLGQGDFLSDPEAAEAQFAEEERARQEIIAACMQREGFEYTPVDYSQFDTFSEDIDDWGSPEWTAEWGFGITTQRFSQAQVGPNLKGWDDSRFEEGEADAFVDPNDDYIQSLGPAEQEAYYEALYGGDDAFPTIDESMSEEEQEALFEEMTFEPQGCEGEAFTEDSGFSFYMEFEDELEEMEKRFEADPRVAERRQEITSCVADKGHDYTDMESLYERFEADLQEIDPYAGGDFEEPDFGISEEEMAQMSEAELDEFFENFEFTEPELSEDDKVKLGELQTEEIELAVAVNECGGGWEQEFEQLADIRAEYEQEFIDTYGDQLEEYRAG